MNIKEAISNAKKMFGEMIDENKKNNVTQKVTVVPVYPDGTRGEPVDITDQVYNDNETPASVPPVQEEVAPAAPYAVAPICNTAQAVPGIIFESPSSYCINGVGSYDPIIYKKMFSINNAYANNTTELFNKIYSENKLDDHTIVRYNLMHNNAISSYRNSNIYIFAGMHTNAILSLYNTMVNMLNITFNKGNDIPLFSFDSRIGKYQNCPVPNHRLDNSDYLFLGIDQLLNQLFDPTIDTDPLVKEGGIHYILISDLNEFATRAYNDLCYQLNMFISNMQFKDESVIGEMFNILNQYFSQFMVSACNEAHTLEANILNVYSAIRESNFKYFEVKRNEEPSYYDQVCEF